MKREIKLAIIVNIISIFVIIGFFLALEYFSGISVFMVLMSFSPAIISGLVGGFIGTVISIRRQPDERAQLILKDSSRNAFWFAIIAIPYLGIIFMFMPALGGLVCGIWLFAFWVITLTVFYASAVYYYWK